MVFNIFYFLKKYIFLFIFFILITGNVGAQEKEKPWEKNAEFGLLVTDGNTSTSSIKGSLRFKHNRKMSKHNFFIKGSGSQSEVTLQDPNNLALEVKRELTTAEEYIVSLTNIYRLNDKHEGIYLITNYEKDRFSGFDYQSLIAFGYGDRFLNSEKHSIDYSVGLGKLYSREPVTNGSVVIGEEKNNVTIIRLDLNYLYTISDSATFTQAMEINRSTDSDENSNTKSISSLVFNMKEALDFKAELNVTHNDTVAMGIERTDAQISISLLYNF